MQKSGRSAKVGSFHLEITSFTVIALLGSRFRGSIALTLHLLPADDQSLAAFVSRNQREKVRQFMEELLAKMVDGPLDDVSVGQLSNDEDCKLTGIRGFGVVRGGSGSEFNSIRSGKQFHKSE